MLASSDQGKHVTKLGSGVKSVIISSSYPENAACLIATVSSRLNITL